LQTVLTQNVLLLGSSQPPSVHTALQGSALGLLLPSSSLLYSAAAFAGSMSAVEQTSMPKSCRTSCSHSGLDWEPVLKDAHTSAAVASSEAVKQLNTAHKDASSSSRILHVVPSSEASPWGGQLDPCMLIKRKLATWGQMLCEGLGTLEALRITRCLQRAGLCKLRVML
jgi:hypothetical protein